MFRAALVNEFDWDTEFGKGKLKHSFWGQVSKSDMFSSTKKDTRLIFRCPLVVALVKVQR
jgi:hypothetical protein